MDPCVACLIFESLYAKELFCAVLSHAEVPEFLVGSAWRFLGLATWRSVTPLRGRTVASALASSGHILFDADRQGVARAVQVREEARRRTGRGGRAAEPRRTAGQPRAAPRTPVDIGP